MRPSNYRDAVNNRFTIYNSLFLNLPFEDIYRTGTLLPLFAQACKDGFDDQLTPVDIVNRFLEDILPHAHEDEKMGLLFKFIQYVERQIVLFDSVEDAAYEEINAMDGKGSLKHLFSRVQSDGLKEALIQKLNHFGLRIVLTAHPTQFYPGTVLGIITDLEDAIRDNNLKHIDLLLQQLGKTPFLNQKKPSPHDEAVSLTWYLENVFYKSVPRVILKIIEFTDLDVEQFNNYDLVKIGFWPGGDRDGNPFVTHDISLQVAKRLRDTALKCYYRDIRILRRRLTFKSMEQIMQTIESGIFNAVYGDPLKGYSRYNELFSDLQQARNILISEHDGLFLDMLDELLIKTKLFGFHMASMDFRQDSRKHLELWGALIRQDLESWNAYGESVGQRLQMLMDYTEMPSPESIQDDFLQEMIKTFYALKTIQQEHGEAACNRYIISNAMYAEDVVLVYTLARNILGAPSGGLALDVIPLFESIEFLASAASVMETLYQNETYRKHLQFRGNKQTIMLGFSDGTKDGGYLQANYSIFHAKEALTAISRKYGISVLFFDGRGGPPARGGGNTHDFYASLGPGIENKEIQITIQGQTISSNFGKPVSCEYNIEQLISAGMENDLYGSRFKALTNSQRTLLQLLANYSYQHYQDLKNHPAFVDYLQYVTPLRFFGETNIGSRPVKRKAGAAFTFEDLRAIPFVGSWAQMKQNVPGFYGMGSAIQQLIQEGHKDEIIELFHESLFFKALVGNSMQSLAKAFFPATAYIRKHPTYGPFWDLLYQEYQTTVNTILDLSGHKILLEDNVLSRDSIKLREQIVLPLITIQQFALQKMLEQGDSMESSERQNMERLILRCMYGIINAARNAA